MLQSETSKSDNQTNLLTQTRLDQEYSVSPGQAQAMKSVWKAPATANGTAILACDSSWALELREV